jgi:tight adherence protein C
MSPLFVATLTLAIGLFVFATALPIGRPSLAERLREYDVDLRVAERRHGRAFVRLPIASWEPLDALLRPLVEDLSQPLRGLTGLLRRNLGTQLQLLDGKADVGGFVAKQVLVAMVMASWPILISLILQLPVSLLTVTVCLALALVGFMLPYATLERRRRERVRRVEAELPQVIDLLALALGLLGLEGAIQRAGQASLGILGAGLRRVHDEVAFDRSLDDALRAMAARNEVPELSSLCDLLISSRDQGLRLGESLTTLATTIRERQANALLAEGGKGSLKVLFPMALVIMPITLAVVFIPGLSALRGLAGS